VKVLLIGQGKILHRLLRPEGALGKKGDEISGAIADAQCLEALSLSKQYVPSNFLPIPDKIDSDKLLGSQIDKLKPDLVLSVQYPWKIGLGVIEATKNRIVNIHNAKLPEFRGHGTISHEILRAEKSHYSSVHLIDERLDFGRLLMESSTAILPHDTAISVWERSVSLIDELVLGLFNDLEKWIDQSSKVPAGGRFYSKHELESLKVVTRTMSEDEISRVARALYFPPFEPAHFLDENRKIYLIPEWNEKSSRTSP
jgi:methionyl-tRNA formyltransferase